MPEIVTEYVFPPIPVRSFDWCAYRDPEGLYGCGRTEVEAINDLLFLEMAAEEEALKYTQKPAFN